MPVRLIPHDPPVSFLDDRSRTSKATPRGSVHPQKGRCEPETQGIPETDAPRPRRPSQRDGIQVACRPRFAIEHGPSNEAREHRWRDPTVVIRP